MEITIRRIHKNEVAVDGYLSINDKQVCDTAECRETALPAGDYNIELVKCKQYGRRVLHVGQNYTRKTEGSSQNYTRGQTPCVVSPDCEKCMQLKTEMVFSNTVMPRVCPMLKMGNGVVGRRDGSIILGERLGKEPQDGQPYAPVWGTMIHPKAAYEKVFDRVRKTIERGKEVRLRVM